MKRYSKGWIAAQAAALMLVSGAAAAADSSAFRAGDGVLLAQASAPLSLSCSVTPYHAQQNNFTTDYCGAPYAAQSYTVVFKVSGGSGNLSYTWNAPTPNGCSSTTASCSYVSRARASDVEGQATVTVTDLGTGVVSTLSVGYLIPATCGAYYFC